MASSTRRTSCAWRTSTAAASGGARRVLFVCTANICRSPMAEEILNALASDRGILVEARSAGTAALVDEPIAPRAREALEEIGMYSGGHSARQVEATMLEEADLVLAMSARQVEALIRLSPQSAEKVHALPAYALGAPEYEGISDPYGQPMFAFRTCVRRLLDCTDGLLSRLQKEG